LHYFPTAGLEETTIDTCISPRLESLVTNAISLPEKIGH
jgi:hypothetical protein